MSRVDVLAVMDQAVEREKDAGQPYAAQVAARASVAAVFDAARAVLSASDFTDLLHAEECLREALAACEPETPHEPV
ncbi:hypothetical protein [Stenotrophomonas maltophilia]|uniref:hypothetical protein n=1 Tax=Stenotrophomonas maltophilia TaxID=40324 RepID=UPI000DF760E9|nr:hypothetical protein [Stenotrophomonas maltophilia]MCF3486976.1 hypothetical protein [Stenotrophomonas maltophilia]MDG9939665.1 hypothetical protein [Stenotrophomonas maltophilia]MDH0559516.1 hypothetical protein [Stenotrophomonas maltophilia]